MPKKNMTLVETRKCYKIDFDWIKVLNTTSSSLIILVCIARIIFFLSLIADHTVGHQNLVLDSSIWGWTILIVF